MRTTDNSYKRQEECAEQATCYDANRYHPVPHATGNGKVHCQVTDSVFLCGKRNDNSKKGGEGIMAHRLAHRQPASNNPDKDRHTGAKCCHFRKIHCRAAGYVFLCGKINNNN
ncbi:hypothetical protein [Parabacteroides sp. ZJ-118]|uniref:hypothetical protein n=1 Tax=Parabacteroides sp. ZJ-118 TaxID=2709398 RepID=UPI0013EA5BA8|nr:hypothetical protein [Parabacteroides sp. ZJ-118]